MGRKLLAVAGLAWLAATVAGFAWLASYANAPGAAAHPDERWPGASAIVLDDTRPTLVMLAHPRCTCTRASLAELAEIMARARVRPRGYVVFIKPGGASRDWEQTDLWRTASSIPGVSVVRDDDGVEARRFGAETSGQVLLYARDGTLLFSGGATGARGHAGDNLGRAAILALLEDAARDDGRPPQTIASSSVFGCSLFDGPDPDRDLSAAARRSHAR